jgi:phosphate starvation-inducible PhoH-like protein
VLFGEKNAHLQKIEDMLDIEISSRGNEVLISGDPVGIERARQILEALWSKIQQGQTIDINTVNSAIRFQAESQNQKKGKNGNGEHSAAPVDSDTSIITRKKKIDARNPVQARYIQAMQKQNLVFGIGPAGTGKTYLAVAMAVAMLEAGRVERIILSRPAVEAGERIGFLPGEMKEKMDPYLRPLYDALHDTMSGEKVQKKIASEEIEIAPLAFMRGRTLNNAFIILDEAQNTTPMQMLMFLTRMGENSRMVVTGDPSQTDLPNHQKSGLAEAVGILTDVEGIEFASFTSADVVRHPLVTKIVQAYEKKRS